MAAFTACLERLPRSFPWPTSLRTSDETCPRLQPIPLDHVVILPLQSGRGPVGRTGAQEPAVNHVAFQVHEIPRTLHADLNAGREQDARGGEATPLRLLLNCSRSR